MLCIYPFPSSCITSPSYRLHCVWRAVPSTESQQEECSSASSSPPDCPFLPDILTYPIQAAPLWPAEYGANLLWTAHHWPLPPVWAGQWSPTSHWPWPRCVCAHVTVQTGLFVKVQVCFWYVMCMHSLCMTGYVRTYVCIPVCRYRCSMELCVGVHTTYRHRLLYVSCTRMSFFTFPAYVTVTLPPLIFVMSCHWEVTPTQEVCRDHSSAELVTGRGWWREVMWRLPEVSEHSWASTCTNYTSL